MSELFYRIDTISDPVVRAIYFHHEMIRIHPFSDGNGRVARIAKKWMLMYDLYPPIYINDPLEKKEYTDTLANSFKALSAAPDQWNDYTSKFFRQELDRLLSNSLWLYDRINEKGIFRSSQTEGRSGLTGKEESNQDLTHDISYVLSCQNRLQG